MSADVDGQESQKVSTIREGAVNVAAGVALAAGNLLYFTRDSGFTQPATWVRVVILVIAGMLSAGAWALWLRGKPVEGRRHFVIPFVVAVGTALAMYLGAALFVIHQRSQPIDVTLGQELAGREQVHVGKKVRELLQDQLLLRRGGSLAPEDLEFEYEFYQDPDHPDADYVVVMVFTADRGSSMADSLADDFDDAITAKLMKAASDVGGSQSVDDAPGRMRCGTVSVEGETSSMCVYAYGVRSVMFFMPAAEAEPESLASAMLADML